VKTSESIKEIAGALAKAQAVMAGAKKDATNPHFRSQYADLASCWEACRDALTKNGISVVQMGRYSMEDEVVVETRLCHSSGEWMEGELALPVTKADAQGYGSALTYARRYGLCAAVGIAPVDDDGNAAAAAKPATKAITGAAVNRAEYDAMTDEEKDFIRSHADAIKKLHLEGKVIADYVAGQHFDPEEKMALWSLLPSDIRSAIKRQTPQPALAEQA
jgi:hypothetical protein